MKSYLLSPLCLLTMLIGLASSGPAHARNVHASSAHASSAQVYLLRGIFNVSVGLDALADKLRQNGIAATVYGHDEEGTVAADALQQYQAGSARPIILVGHSLGAGAAVSVARRLGNSGIPVALVVLLDPVSSAAVPSNVGRAINFYVSGGLGAPVQAEAGFRGSVANMDFKNAGMDHMSIQAADPIHRQIIGYIRAAAARAAAAGGRAASPSAGHATHAVHRHRHAGGAHRQA
jgi:thioesterase domain-containing protein